jgi:hypothetical protein
VALTELDMAIPPEVLTIALWKCSYRRARHQLGNHPKYSRAPAATPVVKQLQHIPRASSLRSEVLPAQAACSPIPRGVVGNRLFRL